MTQIAGRRVLITGGASGMGRRVAMECAARGAADVTLWDLDADRLEATADEIRARGGRLRTGVCNVADRSQVYESARKLERDGGPIDILVNSAGVVSGKSLFEIPDEQIERTFAVNTLALYWLCKAFVPGMVKRNVGHVVTIASASGLVGVAKLSDYAASKWAAIGFDESLRVELRKIAPRVQTTVVCPYYVNTGMFTGVKSRHPRLMPILEEADVARRIVEAVERDRRRLFLPRSMYLVPLFRVLPVPVFDAIADLLGVNVSMNDFVGRQATGGPALDRDAR